MAPDRNQNLKAKAGEGMIFVAPHSLSQPIQSLPFPAPFLSLLVLLLSLLLAGRLWQPGLALLRSPTLTLIQLTVRLSSPLVRPLCWFVGLERRRPACGLGCCLAGCCYCYLSVASLGERAANRKRGARTSARTSARSVQVWASLWILARSTQHRE